MQEAGTGNYRPPTTSPSVDEVNLIKHCLHLNHLLVEIPAGVSQDAILVERLVDAVVRTKFASL